MMRKISVIILFILENIYQFSILINAQVLCREYNMPSPNDSIVIYQQPYVEMVDSGTNCIWNFSSFSEENAISVNYYNIILSSGNNMLCKHQASEHIYYQDKSDSIYIIGRESSLHKVIYLTPEPIIKFPFNYGDTITQSFSICEEWGHHNSQITNGIVRIKADAIGKLILPTDTLDSVIRIYTRKEYQTLNNDTISIVYQSWKWYAPYIRHKIVETIKVQNHDSISMSYSLFFPAMNHPAKCKSKIASANYSTNEDRITIQNVVFYPNPVITDLSVCYTLCSVADISLALYSANGISVYSSQFMRQEPGIYEVQIPLTMIPQGVYTLCISSGEQNVNKEIIKI